MRLLSALLFTGVLAAQSFDYYVLSLSWSPLYCSDPQRAARDRTQCGEGRRYAFVTHGLWPNNIRPPHPKNCGSARPVPRSLVDRMLSIMPSPGLIQHEWRSHGTCSGLSVDDYFAKIRAAYELVRIPHRYQSPSRDLVVPANTLRQDFRQANPQIPADAIRFDCTGRNLREVRVCLTRDLKPRPCAVSVRDTCGDRPVTMLRVR
jgi:ribonuclease T2